jgi:hypothetical protein
MQDPQFVPARNALPIWSIDTRPSPRMARSSVERPTAKHEQTTGPPSSVPFGARPARIAIRSASPSAGELNSVASQLRDGNDFAAATKKHDCSALPWTFAPRYRPPAKSENSMRAARATVRSRTTSARTAVRAPACARRNALRWLPSSCSAWRRRTTTRCSIASLRRVADERALDSRAARGASPAVNGLLGEWFGGGWLYPQLLLKQTSETEGIEAPTARVGLASRRSLTTGYRELRPNPRRSRRERLNSCGCLGM